MNNASYGTPTEAEASVLPGEHIPGPPHGGLIVLWVFWIIAAAVMAGLGGAIFFGIFEAVNASPF